MYIYRLWREVQAAGSKIETNHKLTKFAQDVEGSKSETLSSAVCGVCYCPNILQGVLQHWTRLFTTDAWRRDRIEL